MLFKRSSRYSGSDPNYFLIEFNRVSKYVLWTSIGAFRPGSPVGLLEEGFRDEGLFAGGTLLCVGGMPVGGDMLLWKLGALFVSRGLFVGWGGLLLEGGLFEGGLLVGVT